MDSHGTVTYWLDRLKAGDEIAAQNLWQAYCERLAALALQHLRGAPRRAIDEYDAALEAFHSFLTGFRRGRFHKLEDRNDLWQVLIFVTRCKARNQRKHQLRKKRGSGRVLGESAFDGNALKELRGIEELVDTEPTPAEAAQLVEEFNLRLEELSEDLRVVALLRLEGHAVQEIAAQFRCVSRTIERKLQLIRATSSGELIP